MQMQNVFKTLSFCQLILTASSEFIRGGGENNSSSNQRQLGIFSDAPDTRIIGGDEASKGRYSYAVSLQDSQGHFCGGSLIAPDIVLCAAHCKGGPYKVVMGRHGLDTKNGDSVEMKQEIPHPKYNDKTTNNDFMVIVLDRPTNANVEMVKINSNKNSPGVNDPVTVMGWGDTAKADDVQKLSDELMHVEVNVISNNECDASKGSINGDSDNYNGQITGSMLCARDNNQDSCQGDSGGPLVIKGSNGNGADDIQVGVVSWGIGCASQHFPGVYARVSSEYDWIKSQVCNCSSDPPADFDCSGVSGSCGSGNGSSGGSNGGGSNNVDGDDNVGSSNWDDDDSSGGGNNWDDDDNNNLDDDDNNNWDDDDNNNWDNDDGGKRDDDDDFSFASSNGGGRDDDDDSGRWDDDDNGGRWDDDDNRLDDDDNGGRWDDDDDFSRWDDDWGKRQQKKLKMIHHKHNKMQQQQQQQPSQSNTLRQHKKRNGLNEQRENKPNGGDRHRGVGRQRQRNHSD